ncbi:O-antigen ligase family protein [Rhodococcus pyridinivorans]
MVPHPLTNDLSLHLTDASDRPKKVYAFWVAFSAFLSVFASAIQNRFGFPNVYWYGAATVLIILLVCTVNRGAQRRGALSNIFLVLVAWGFAGSLAGRLFFGESENALPFFFSLSLIAVWWVRGRALPIDGALGAFRIAGIVYAATAICVVQFGIPISSEGNFHHQTAYFIALGAITAAVCRKWWDLALITWAAVVCYLNYPALTYVLVAAVVIPTVVAYYLDRKWIAWVGGLSAVLVLFLVTNLERINEWSAQYFQAVGKTDNSHAREVLLRIGLEKLMERPIFGSGFTEKVAVYAPRNITGPYKFVPVHNDYLQLAMVGGLIFATLFTAASLVLVLFALNYVSRKIGSVYDRRVLAVSAGVLGTLLIMCTVNPILIDARVALLFAVCVLVILSSIEELKTENRGG